MTCGASEQGVPRLVAPQAMAGRVKHQPELPKPSAEHDPSSIMHRKRCNDMPWRITPMSGMSYWWSTSTSSASAAGYQGGRPCSMAMCSAITPPHQADRSRHRTARQPHRPIDPRDQQRRRRSICGAVGSLSRKQVEGLDVSRSENAEVAVIEGGDLAGTEPLGNRDQTGVCAAESEVGVDVDELGRPLSSHRR